MDDFREHDEVEEERDPLLGSLDDDAGDELDAGDALAEDDAEEEESW